MSRIVMYTKDHCPFCEKAKALLKEKGQHVEEIRIDLETGKADEMVQKTGGLRSVPQIFIDDAHVGGCDDLFALESKNELDPLL